MCFVLKRSKLTLPLLLLFIGSGSAALIYEVVWFHLLRFTIGSSQLSIGILLISFMGGMCLGSLLFHRFVSRRHHPLKVYAFIELAIGVCGVLILLLLPTVTKVYVSIAGYGVLNIIGRSMICLVILLPPTMLMGATLPAIARWLTADTNGAAQLGLFYGGNILGAVLGTVLAGFYLLREFDVYIASGVAIVINLAVATVGLLLGLRSEYSVAKDSISSGKHQPVASKPVMVAIALSGFTALGAQVIWTRLLSVLLGSTVYTFSIILAVFLAGLGIGSVVGAKQASRLRRPVVAFGLCQLLLLLAIAFAGYMIVSVRPHFPAPVTMTAWLDRTAWDVLRVAIAILPATILWGASFPFAVVAAGFGGRDPSQVVGKLYALNTIGAIAAVLMVIAVLIPLTGTRVAQQVLIGVAGISAIALLVHPTSAWLQRNPQRLPIPAATLVSVLTVIAIVSLSSIAVPKLSAGLVAYGREEHRWNEPEEYMHVAEGVSAYVAVSRQKETGYRNFHIGGKVVASTFPEDMRLQRMLGHAPALFHPNPKSVLIIGFGAGVTAGSFVLHDSIERIVIVEIEPQVVSAAARYFREENYNVLDDQRTEIIFDDGRHYLATTKDKFDIITADPVNPWVKGAAALYTKEYYELSKKRLNQGGLLTQWVPLYETNESAVKSEVGTFFESFPYGSVWNSQKGNRGYDVFLLAGNERTIIDASSIREKLNNNQALMKSLNDVEIHTEIDLLKSFSGQRFHLSGWLENFERNLDRNLRLEYLAGQALDHRAEQNIYQAMTANTAFTDQTFKLSENEEEELRSWFKRTYGN